MSIFQQVVCILNLLYVRIMGASIMYVVSCCIPILHIVIEICHTYLPKASSNVILYFFIKKQVTRVVLLDTPKKLKEKQMLHL